MPDTYQITGPSGAVYEVDHEPTSAEWEQLQAYDRQFVKQPAAPKQVVSMPGAYDASLVGSVEPMGGFKGFKPGGGFENAVELANPAFGIAQVDSGSHPYGLTGTPSGIATAEANHAFTQWVKSSGLPLAVASQIWAAQHGEEGTVTGVSQQYATEHPDDPLVQRVGGLEGVKQMPVSPKAEMAKASEAEQTAGMSYGQWLGKYAQETSVTKPFVDMLPNTGIGGAAKAGLDFAGQVVNPLALTSLGVSAASDPLGTLGGIGQGFRTMATGGVPDGKGGVRGATAYEYTTATLQSLGLLSAVLGAAGKGAHALAGKMESKALLEQPLDTTAVNSVLDGRTETVHGQPLVPAFQAYTDTVQRVTPVIRAAVAADPEFAAKAVGEVPTLTYGDWEQRRLALMDLAVRAVGEQHSQLSSIPDALAMTAAEVLAATDRIGLRDAIGAVGKPIDPLMLDEAAGDIRSRVMLPEEAVLAMRDAVARGNPNIGVPDEISDASTVNPEPATNLPGSQVQGEGTGSADSGASLGEHEPLPVNGVPQPGSATETGLSGESQLAGADATGHGGVVGGSLGLHEFVSQDVVPTVEQAAAKIKQASGEMKSAFSLSKVSDQANYAVNSLRDALARLTLLKEQTAAAVDVAHKYVQLNGADLSRRMAVTPEFARAVGAGAANAIEAGRLAFYQAIQTGAALPDPKLQAMADALRGQEQKWTKLATQEGVLGTAMDNYNAQFWKERTSTTPGQNAVARNPLGGPKRFNKGRIHETILDGMESGLTPLTTDPVVASMMHVEHLKRAILEKWFTEDAAYQGLGKWMGIKSTIPDGWVKTGLTKFGPRSPQGLRTIGAEYWAHPDVATVLKRYLSPGLAGKASYDVLRAIGNSMNQLQLGISPFHLGFVGLDSISSKASLALEKLSHGDIAGAAKDFATAPVAPLTTLLKGRAVVKAAIRGVADPDMARMINSLVSGGMRFSQDDFYKQDWWNSMRSAIGNANPIGAAARAPLAALEFASKPIFEKVVPWMKAGVATDMASYELSRMPAGYSQQELRNVMADVVQSVDNRMGQMTYDNIFWDRTLKDAAMVGVRSLGWNLGTAQELGGGAMDIGKGLYRAVKGGGFELTHRGAYTVMMPISTAIMGSILGYLYTGHGPSNLLDTFAVPTGQKDANGNEIRRFLPSYMSQLTPAATRLARGDVGGALSAAANTATHKLNPLPQAMWDMYHNKDFYGTQIFNEDDPLVSKMLDNVKYFAKQFVPFSYRNEAQAMGETGHPDVPIMFGVTQAPKELSKTPAQLKAEEILGSHMPDAGRTQAEVDKKAAQQQIVQEIRSGKTPDLSKMSKRDSDRVIAKGTMSHLGYLVKGMKMEDAANVWGEASPTEKADLAPVLRDKLGRETGDSLDATEEFLSAHPAFWAEVRKIGKF